MFQSWWSESRRRWTATLGLGVAGAVLVALFAVASSSTASSIRSSSKTPIKMMFVSPVTGPTVESFPMDSQVAKAFTKTLNAKGGINGHPVDLIYCNDQSQPNLDAACARQAVQDHVVAAVGFTYNGAQLDPILNAAHIPWIPTTAGSTPENTLPNSFPVTASYLATVGNGLLTAAYCKHPEMLSIQSEGAAFILDLTQVGTKAAGFNGLTSAQYLQYPPTTTDFAPIVAQALAAHPDCLVLPVEASSATAIFAAEKQAGASVRVIGDAGTTILPTDIAQDPAQTKGGVLADDVSDDSGAGWAAYLAAVKKYASSSYDYNALQPQATWLAMTVATEVAGNVTGSLTAKKMLAKLATSSSVSLGHMAPPINFTTPFKGLGGAFPRYFVRDLYFEGVKNGKIVALYNNRPFDVTPAFQGKSLKLP